VKTDDPYYEVLPIDSPLNEPSPGKFFCCFDYGTEPKPLHFCRFGINREDHIKNLNDNTECMTKFCRIGLYVMHFAAYYFIFYPLTLLFSYIPYLGTVTTFIFTLTAFLLSVVSYFIILVIAWVMSRPIFAILLLVGIVGAITAWCILKPKIKDSSKGWETKGSYNRYEPDNRYNQNLRYNKF
jgi:hypothetical protein